MLYLVPAGQSGLKLLPALCDILLFQRISPENRSMPPTEAKENNAYEVYAGP
jgi:hypothetical protein